VIVDAGCYGHLVLPRVVWHVSLQTN
jgi:hypothetical protein